MKCQCCNGEGGETEPVLEYGMGPYYECGYCNGEGKISLFKWIVWEYNLWGLDCIIIKSAKFIRGLLTIKGKIL